MYVVLTVVVFVSMTDVVSSNTSPLSEYIHVPGKYVAPIPANSLRVERGVSLPLCAAKCTLEFRMKNFPCYAFEYTPGSQMCVHTNITSLVINGGYTGLKSNPAVHYYERTKVSYANLFHGLPNAALKEQKYYYDIKFNRTKEQCAFDCLSSTKQTCMSFSHSASSGACGLSRAFYQAGQSDVSLQRSSLYTHYQFFTKWPCNATLPENYAPRILASLRYPYHSIRQANCYARLEAPLGKQVQIKFPVLYFERNSCDTAGYGITVYDGNSASGPMLGRFCHSLQDRSNPPVVTSTSGSLYVHYEADQTPLAFESLYTFVQIDPCNQNKCQHGATCKPTNSSYTCACAAGYTGTLCEVDIDDCASSPCYFGGQCVDLVDAYRCHCTSEFTGERCSKFVGACASNPCIHGSCTISGRHNYTCTCEKGYAGRNCDEVVTPCMPNPCQHGVCREMAGNFICQCESGYKGRLCNLFDFCALKPCNHGNCSMISDSTISCACERGYGGKYCDTLLNPCENVNCNYGSCDKVSGTCHCPRGVKGQFCDDVSEICSVVNCGNGRCYPYPRFREGYVCYCSDGRYRSHCNDTNGIDNCSTSPCVHGSCTSHTHGYTCTCPATYKGVNCEEAITCMEADCGDGLCADGADGYACICPKGYTGNNCESKAHVQDTSLSPTHPSTDACQHHDCFNGGTCIKNDLGQVYCTCLSNWTGDFCERFYWRSARGNCSTSSCHVTAACVDLHPGYQCICMANMTGENCDVSMLNPCLSNPCKQGRCQGNGSTFKCALPAIQSFGNTTTGYNALPNSNRVPSH